MRYYRTVYCDNCGRTILHLKIGQVGYIRERPFIKPFLKNIKEVKCGDLNGMSQLTIIVCKCGNIIEMKKVYKNIYVDQAVKPLAEYFDRIIFKNAGTY